MKPTELRLRVSNFGFLRQSPLCLIRRRTAWWTKGIERQRHSAHLAQATEGWIRHISTYNWPFVSFFALFRRFLAYDFFYKGSNKKFPNCLHRNPKKLDPKLRKMLSLGDQPYSSLFVCCLLLNLASPLSWLLRRHLFRHLVQLKLQIISWKPVKWANDWLHPQILQGSTSEENRGPLVHTKVAALP